MVALFEVGSMTTSLQVMKDGEVLYERDQAFGGAQLTQLIVRQYGFSPEEPKPRSATANCPTTTRLGAASLCRAWRRRSAVPCSSSSPAPRSTGSITSCWPGLGGAAGLAGGRDLADLVRLQRGQSFRRHADPGFGAPQEDDAREAAYLTCLALAMRSSCQEF
jgi:hypothetical protein